MPTNHQADAPISYEDCEQYFDEQVFRLQPPYYCEAYPIWPGMVGLELEVFVLIAESLKEQKPRLAPLHQPEPSIAKFLQELAARQPDWQPEFAKSDAGEDATLMRVVMEKGDQISFEPGGQLEFSSIPYPCLGDALARLRAVQKLMDEALPGSGLATKQLGINPWHSVEEIGLQMAKARYQAMNRHFAAIGEYGQRMMRQTCTMQVNLDFGVDETVMAQRYLAAQLLAPYATAIFAFSPYVDGKKTEYKSFRSRIWQSTDPGRTGFPNLQGLEKDLSKKAACASYLESVMDAPVIFVEAAGYKNPEKPVRFRQWLQEPIFGVHPTMADLKTHLSLHFPEVRVRGFLELRSIDAQARSWQSVVPAFYTGIFYDEKALASCLDLLLEDLPKIESLWHESSYGLRSQAMQRRAMQLGEIAMAGFLRLPPCFREKCAAENMAAFFAHFTAAGKSPADDLIALTDKASELTPSVATIDKLNDHWQTVAKQAQ